MEMETEKALLSSEQFAKFFKESGLTQEEIAEELGISDRYVRTLKSTNKDVSISLAYNISKKFGCPIENILTAGAGAPRPQAHPVEPCPPARKTLAQNCDLFHSLKNKLQNISGLFSILKLKCEIKNIKIDTLTPLNQEISELIAMLTEYLKTSLPADLCLYSLNQIILETKLRLQPQFAAQNIAIKTRLAQNLPEIPLNKKRLQQVLVNCLANSRAAILASGKPSGRIFLWTNFDESAGTLQLLIADNGVGLTPEQQANFFKPGYTTKPDGNGIGACISLAAIKQHGGSMTVSGAPGEGCCIRIKLPVRHTRQFNDDDFYAELGDMFF